MRNHPKISPSPLSPSLREREENVGWVKPRQRRTQQNHSHATPRTQRGFLLIVAVVLIVTVGLLAAVITFLTTGNVLTSASHANSAKALFVAESGLERGIYGYKNGTFCTSLSTLTPPSTVGEGNFAIAGTFNIASIALGANITAADTIIPVASTAGFASQGRIRIENEDMDYAALTATSFTGVRRGVAGSTAVLHNTGATVNVAQDECLVRSTGIVSLGSTKRVVEKGIQNPGAMMVYAKANGSGTVYYRRWDGTQWGPERTTGIAASTNIQFFVLRFARTRNEAILGIQSSNGDISVQMWNGLAWTAPPGMPTPLTNVTGTYDQQRGFDIRYERASDEAIVVYNTNTSNQVSYRTWNGVTWSGASTLSLVTTDVAANIIGIPAWIEMAENPLSSSNDVALLVLGDNASNPRIYGRLWNGTAWVQLEAGAALVWDTTVAPSTYKAMDVAYEQQTGRAMFIWGDNVANSVRYRIWNGSSLAVSATIPGLTAMAGTASWIRLVSNPFSDQLMFGVMDSGRDLNTALWSGSAWTVHAEHDNSTEIGTDRNFDIVFESHPTNVGDAWLIWGGRNFGGTRRAYVQQWTGGVWTITAVYGQRTALVQLATQPATGALFVGIYQDDNSSTDDVTERHLTGGSATLSTEVIIWGGPIVTNPVLERLYISAEKYSPLVDWNEIFP